MGKRAAVLVVVLGWAGCKSFTGGDDAPADPDAGPPVCEPPMPTGACKIEFGTARVDPGQTAVLVAMGDLDGDQRLDLVTSNGVDGVRVSFGLGGGTFSATVAYPTGAAVSGIGLGDVDGDGDGDIAAANHMAGTLTVLFNQGSRSFVAPPTPYATGAGPTAVVIADFDSDGSRAIAVAHYDAGEVWLFRDVALATQPAVSQHASLTDVRAMSAGDLDGDGKLDLVSLRFPMAGSHPMVYVQRATATGFAAGVGYATGPYPDSLAIADLDGDGDRDVAVANGGEPSISVLRNAGDGTLGTQEIRATETTPHAVTASDLDGDGAIDLVTTARRGVAVYRNQGTGTFGAPVTYVSGGDSVSGGFEPWYVTAGDVSGDGKPDLVSTSDAGVSILRNDGSGRFPMRPTIATSVEATALVGARLDGDDLLDFVVADWPAARMHVFLGRGDGTFDQRTFASVASPSAVAVGDLDGDAVPELVVTSNATRTVNVHAGHGDGSFDPPASYATGSAPTRVVIVDVNRDGRADLVVANDVAFPGASDPEGDSLGLYLNQGDGTFAPQARYPVPGPRGMATGDLDGDGAPDLVVASSRGDEIRVFLARGDELVGATPVPAPGQPFEVELADFDGDCVLDLAHVRFDGEVTIRRGSGDGRFERIFAGPVATARVSQDIHDLVARDLDGDGRPDLVAPNVLGVSILLVEGDGTVQHRSYATNGAAWLVGDVDRDGHPDLVASAPAQGVPTGGELQLVTGGCRPAP